MSAPDHSFDLADRHALVTGAGRGIGRATALCLAGRGAALTLVARSEAELLEVQVECLELGAPSVSCEVVDLLDREALDELAGTVAAGADVLVNNAGSAPSAALERTDDDLFDATLDLNLFAPFALSRAALPAMAERGWGRIVNVASTAAREGYAYTSAYVASKHALLGLTRALTAEASMRWREADLTINAVCPGFVDTDIVARSAERIAESTGVDSQTAKARLAAMNAGGRLLSPEEVAEAIGTLVCEQPGQTHGAAWEFAAADA
ncbi:MAG: SDR family NAD(P)-dependent oxidoreductase [Planctomycetota bacterium]|nr:SDR family NAD(P)-dependent oxidoreductase [Planctomycetota bacterium]